MSLKCFQATIPFNENSTQWFCYSHGEAINKMTAHPLGNMNIHIKCHGNLTSSGHDILQWTRMTYQHPVVSPLAKNKI